MTDKPTSLSTHAALPSQTLFTAPTDPIVKDDVPQKVETVEEEPYTIKCICNFSDDDGNTIYCETCDTWQHIECFYPDNKEDVFSDDFAHSCAECKPRPLNRARAVERAIQLKNPVFSAQLLDKKSKRPPPKSHKKKPKPADIQVNGAHNGTDTGKPANTGDAPPSKRSKSSHKTSHSVSSQPPKRSPSHGASRPSTGRPPSPVTSPPDLPENFEIHHYSEKFHSLYNEQAVNLTQNNSFASLAIPTALSRWLREPDTMKQETGRTHADVFQEEPQNLEERRPRLEVEDATRRKKTTTVHWRFMRTYTPIQKDAPIIELNGEIGFQKDYCANPGNLWGDLSSPLPFVFFHPVLPLYIDTRKEGSIARYVRRSCKPNAQLDTYLSGGSEYHFWLVSDRHIAANEQITLPWDFRLEKSVGSRWLNLLGLRDDENFTPDEPEMDDTEYNAISNWIDRILSEYGGCACDLDNNCAFARFHRHYLFGRHPHRLNGKKKRGTKGRSHTVSPTSTGHATNSRAPSEGNGDDGADDTQSQTGSSRSKPPSRDRTPHRQGSLDQPGILSGLTDRDKRKVAMVEDSFRRMEHQPPRKKKRISDGTSTSGSSKPKSRNGSIAPAGTYVDAGTSRSKSGSPADMKSPGSLGSSKAPAAHGDSMSAISRQRSITPRPGYCNAGVQTDPVHNEWFSRAVQSPKPRRRIISLSKRLLNCRLKTQAEEEQRLAQTPTTQTSNGSVVDVESPTMAQRTNLAGLGLDMQHTLPQSSDVVMSDAPAGPVTESNAIEPGPAPNKTPDLHVQLPPVPAFDNTVLNGSTVTTPQSASSSVAQSPFSTFAPPAVNGVASHPSPVKKKLSLSDYKSRLSKSTAKTPTGAAPAKSSLISPDGTKTGADTEVHAVEKAEEPAAGLSSTTAPVTNGS